jgi:hypothetical protein
MKHWNRNKIMNRESIAASRKHRADMIAAEDLGEEGGGTSPVCAVIGDSASVHPRNCAAQQRHGLGETSSRSPRNAPAPAPVPAPGPPGLGPAPAPVPAPGPPGLGPAPAPAPGPGPPVLGPAPAPAPAPPGPAPAPGPTPRQQRGGRQSAQQSQQRQHRQQGAGRRGVGVSVPMKRSPEGVEGEQSDEPQRKRRRQ